MTEYRFRSKKDGTVITNLPTEYNKMSEAQLAELDALLAQARSSGTKEASWGGAKSTAQDKTTAPAKQAPAQTASVAPVAGQPVEGQTVQETMQPQDPSMMQQVGGAIGNFVLPGGMEEVKRNAGAAVRGLAGGVANTAGIIVDPITAIANLVTPGKQDYMTLNQSIQSLLTQVGVPNVATEAEKILQAGISGLSGGGAGVAAGRAFAGVPGAVGAIGQSMASAPLAQLTGGAGGEAGGQAGESIARGLNAPPLVRAGAQLAGGLVGGVGGGMMNNPVTPGIVSDAASAGIPLKTTDVFPPQTSFGKQVQKVGDMIPITGTGASRVAQQKARVESVDDIIAQYGAGDFEGLSAEVMKDLSSQVGKEGSFFKKWGGVKNEVIDRLSGQETMPVALARTNAKIDESIKYLEGLKSVQNQPIIDILSDWKQALKGQNLENVETLRKQIGEAFLDPKLAPSKSTGEKILSSIYGPLNEDMGDHIRVVGSDADYNKWKVANTTLSKKIEELKLPVLKTVLDKGEATPNEINKLLFSANSSDIRALYRNLSPEGRALARSAVIAKAAEKSGKAGTNPDKFATEIDKLGKSVGVLFSGDDLKQVNGLTKALNMTRRAQEAGVAPNTGMLAVLPIGAFGLGALGQSVSKDLGGTLLAGGAAGAIGLAPRIYDSKPVRNILINLSQLKENTPEAAALVATLARTISSMGKEKTNETRKARNETE